MAKFNLFGTARPNVSFENIIALDGGGFAVVYVTFDATGAVSGTNLAMFQATGADTFERVAPDTVLDPAVVGVAMLATTGGGVATYVGRGGVPVQSEQTTRDATGTEISSSVISGHQFQQLDIFDSGLGPFDRSTFAIGNSDILQLSSDDGTAIGAPQTFTTLLEKLVFDAGFCTQFVSQTQYNTVALIADAGPAPTFSFTPDADFPFAIARVAAGNRFVLAQSHSTETVGPGPDFEITTRLNIVLRIAAPNAETPERLIELPEVIDGRGRVILTEIEGVGFAALILVQDTKNLGALKSAQLRIYDFEGDLLGTRAVNGMVGQDLGFQANGLVHLTALQDPGLHETLRLLVSWQPEGSDTGISAQAFTFTPKISADGTGLADLMRGLGGNDGLEGLAGNDSILGLGGEDNLLGQDGNDTLDGGAQDDFLLGGTGADLVFGGTGNDIFLEEEGQDLLFGGQGDDNILAGADNDSVEGGDGKDTLSGEAGNDVIIGGIGNDTLNGGAGDDKLSGDEDSDLLNGNDGKDTLRGKTGDDTLNGGEGDDDLAGSFGNDAVFGGTGDDFLTGEQGDDTLNGGDGDDLLSSAEGNDSLQGGLGSDELNGFSGNDTLDGGAGADLLAGGAAADRFIFRAGSDTGDQPEFGLSTTFDIIVDYNFNGGDRIDFSGMDANTNTHRNNAFKFLFTAAFDGHAGQLRTGKDPDGTLFIEGDLDGDGAGDFLIFLEGVRLMPLQAFIL